MNDKKIKVLQLGSPTGLYGAERWILALARYLDSNKIDVIVSVLRDDPNLAAPLCDEARKLGLRTHVFNAYGQINWSAVSQLRRFIVDNNIHILHTHGYKTDVIGLFATRKTNCRLITTPHGWSVKAGFKLGLYEAFDRFIFRYFDIVAPLSETLFSELSAVPSLRDKLRLIENGVDLLEIDTQIQLAQELLQWKEEGYFLVGYIGQLIERKNLKVLIEAFAKFSLPKKKLILLGEGEQRQELEKLTTNLNITHEVEFLGFRDDRLSFLKGFDIFVLPSRLEGIPRCLMEAMGAKIPVIASDIPGCNDLVKHDQTGLLFELSSSESLLGCLNQFKEINLRSRLGQAGRDFIRENYSAASMAKKYEIIYENLLI